MENMQPVITIEKTYIAPFINAEGPQYLVVEDSFPNGRPALEKAGVYVTDRDTVNKSERNESNSVSESDPYGAWTIRMHAGI